MPRKKSARIEIAKLEKRKESLRRRPSRQRSQHGKKDLGRHTLDSLQATELKSTNGAISPLKPIRIFATGNNGKTDYTLPHSRSLSGITAVRLEMLADDRLPGKGPGLGDGNFVLARLSWKSLQLAIPRNSSESNSPAHASF